MSLFNFILFFVGVPLIILSISAILIKKIKKKSYEGDKYEGNKYEEVGYLLLIVSIYIPLAIYYYWKYIEGQSFIENLAQTGDYLGGTTIGVLTVASIFFLIATLRLQKRSLETQEDKLNESNKLASMQYFDTSFHSLLKVLNENKSKLQDESFKIDRFTNETSNANSTNELKTYHQDEAIDIYFYHLIKEYRRVIIKQFYLDTFNEIGKEKFSRAAKELKDFFEKDYVSFEEIYTDAKRNLEEYESIIREYRLHNGIYDTAAISRSKPIIEFSILEEVYQDLELSDNKTDLSEEVKRKIKENTIYRAFVDNYLQSNEYKRMALESINSKVHHYSMESYFKTIESFIELFYHSNIFRSKEMDEKQFYIKLLNIQLSRQEKTILWNRILLRDEGILRASVKEYDFFKSNDIDENSLIPFKEL